MTCSSRLHFLSRLSLGTALMILSGSPVGAAPTLPSGIHFYKSPQSLFPSGQMHRRELEKSELKEDWIYSFLVQQGPKRFWIKSHDVLRDLDLAQSVIDQKTRTTWQITQRQGSWLQVQQNGKLTWMSQKDLRPDPQDLGFGMNVIATSLRRGPRWDSELQIMLPPLSSLKLLKFEGSWAYVSFASVGTVQGWVDLSNLVLKADFASFALLANGMWRPIKYRENDSLWLDHNDKVHLSQVQQLLTRSDQAIIVKKIPGFDLALRTNLQIIKVEADRWGQSSLRGHGLVFWKKNVEDNQGFLPLDSKGNIKTEELLKREITSVAFHPLDPLKGIVSAGGIYTTTNGEDWKLLRQFKDQNYPVSFGPQGQWIIGSHWSHDQGKNFQNFVSWEKLGHLLMQQTSGGSRTLRLQEVRSLSSGRLKLLVDTGLQQFAFVADVRGSQAFNWRIDPTLTPIASRKTPLQ